MSTLAEMLPSQRAFTENYSNYLNLVIVKCIGILLPWSASLGMKWLLLETSSFFLLALVHPDLSSLGILLTKEDVIAW